MTKYINSIHAFFSFLEENNSSFKPRVFRGVKDVSYKLIPSVGRHLTKRTNACFTSKEEEEMLNSFKMKAFSHLENKEISKLELLSLAQHHGLPTRLLDWTWNPLVAFYFAVKSDYSGDSLVYVWEKDIIGEYLPNFDPFQIGDVKLVLPLHLSNRIIAQSSLFSIHNEPHIEFIPKDLEMIIINLINALGIFSLE